MDEIKKYVARLMDRLADLMHDYQKFAPLVSLIDMQKQSSSWLQLMGDQDWHRGRFALQAPAARRILAVTLQFPAAALRAGNRPPPPLAHALLLRGLDVRHRPLAKPA